MGKSLIVRGANFAANGIAQTYKRLAWIGCTNKNGEDTAETPLGQYINSGALSTINTKLVFEFTMPTNAGNSVYLVGCNVSNRTNLFAWAQAARIVIYMGYSTGTTANGMFINVNPRDDKRHVLEISKECVVLDGIVYQWEVTPSSDGATAPIFLDCCSRPPYDYNSKAALGDFMIHNVKIYSDYQDESSLVVDAIPVKRLTDDVIGFYNAVNGMLLLRNNGSTPMFGVE